jgi:flagellar biosynthetic protein FliQ
MNELDVIEIVRQTLWVSFVTMAPALGVGAAVGLVVSLVQALTQIQEMTISFIPKIVAVMLTSLITLPFMYHQLATFAEQVFLLIERGGGS